MSFDHTPDGKDLAILDLLQADGRVPSSEFGRRIGLSRSVVSERVKRLAEAARAGAPGGGAAMALNGTA